MVSAALVSDQAGESPIERLPEFLSWGGEACENLAREAFRSFIGNDLTGLRVLEIGAREGKMCLLFALLGADVTGVDVDGAYFPRARTEADRLGLSHRVRFQEYDGDPASLKGEPYDLVFTKSVLLLVSDLERFMERLAARLKPGGKVVFIENAYRGPLDLVVRRLAHIAQGTYSIRLPAYMTEKRLQDISRQFNLEIVRRESASPLKSRSSGWYLVCGTRR